MNNYSTDTFKVRHPGTGYKYYKGVITNVFTHEWRLLRKRHKTAVGASSYAARVQVRLVRMQQLAQQIKELDELAYRLAELDLQEQEAT